MSKNVKIILTGGFLEAGKTTLLAKASQQLMKRGKNITDGIDTISIRGSAGGGEKCKLTVNARVETTPENLDAILRTVLK